MRTFVVVCCRRVALSAEAATPVADHPITEPLSPLYTEIRFAPFKRYVDVVLDDLVAPGTQAWIIDAATGPREIRPERLAPSSEVRVSHLITDSARRWAASGGLVPGALHEVQGAEDLPARDLPDGTTPAYFNFAPVDQQLNRFCGDEIVSLSTRRGKAWCRLPSGELNLHLVDTTPRRVLRMMLDTVVLSPDSAEALLFWRASISRPAGAPTPELYVEHTSPPAVPRPEPAMKAPVEVAASSMAYEETVVGSALPPPPAVVHSESPRPVNATASPPSPGPPRPAQPAPPPAPVPPPAAPASVDLELIARLEAERAMGAITFAASLAAQGLDVASLDAQCALWSERMADESKRGRRLLQSRYDEAVLARVEQLRGRPVTPRDYAKITVAVERKGATEALVDLGLAPGLLLLLHRIYFERTAQSDALRQELISLIDEERAI